MRVQLQWVCGVVPEHQPIAALEDLELVLLWHLEEVTPCKAARGELVVVYVATEDSNLLANGLGSLLVVAGDDNDSDACTVALGDGGLDLAARRVDNAHHAHKGHLVLELHVLVRVVDATHNLCWLRGGGLTLYTAWRVACGTHRVVDFRVVVGHVTQCALVLHNSKGKAAQGAAGHVLQLLVQLLADLLCQGNHAAIVAPVGEGVCAGKQGESVNLLWCVCVWSVLT